MAKQVHALVGTDSFLQLQKLAEIVRACGADTQRIDLDGESAQPADVFDELRSFAMFGGSKAVILRNADEFLKKHRELLEAYCENPCDSAILVLRLISLPKTQRIYKIIAKTGVIEVCDPPAEKDLPRWIINHAKTDYQLTIAPDAAAMLAELLGADLGRLDSEIAKLAIASPGKADAAALKGTVAFQRDQEMWEMTTELASGKTAAALRRWRQLIQTDTSAEFKAVTWLGMWLEDVASVLAAKKNGSVGAVSAKLGWKYRGERLSQFLRTVDALGASGYDKALNLLAQIDYQSKTGVGDAAENVERFILSVGR